MHRHRASAPDRFGEPRLDFNPEAENTTQQNANRKPNTKSKPLKSVDPNRRSADHPDAENSTCPEFFSCYGDVTPPCTCGASCPLASFKESTSATNVSLLDLADATWRTSLNISETFEGVFTRNVSVEIQPDRSQPFGVQGAGCRVQGAGCRVQGCEP